MNDWLEAHQDASDLYKVLEELSLIKTVLG